jgi:ribosomal protein L37AE/L43A
MDATIDWTEAFAEAGAAPCPKCGKSALFLAQDLHGDDDAARDRREQTGIWICFECGHEQQSAAR